jgi:DNA-binding transcriptional LysR family regulator
MEMRQLRYLVAVVEERSISRAAARLNMSQPPLSATIAQMERELGVKLLDRHARGVEPTEAGGYLVDHARRLLANLDEISATVVAVGTGLRGHITLAGVSGTSWELLPAALASFARDRPDVGIEITDTAPDDAIDRVRTRRADAALVFTADAGDLERHVAPDLEAALAGREPVLAVLPERDGGYATTVDLAALTGHRWLLPPDPSGWPELAELARRAWQRAGIAPAAAHTVATLNTAVDLVAAGFGVALAPASVRRLTRPGVVVRPLRQHLPPIDSAVVWRRHERPSPVLAQFLRAAMATPEPDRLGPEVARR